jgi:DNA repair protein RadC
VVEFKSLQNKGRPMKPIKPITIKGQKYFKVGECLVPDYVYNFSKKQSIERPELAVPYFSELKTLEQETLQILTLDGSHAPISVHTITVGLVNQSQLHCREVFRKAISDNAVSIMIAHNHPSGNLKASDADIQSTIKLYKASKIIGITLIDHLIITKNEFLSIREKHSHCWDSY